MEEQMYKLFYDQHPDAVITLDLNGRVVAANPALLHLTGENLASLSGLQMLRSFLLLCKKH
jgi:PAS domain S-box-containing protein